MLIQCRTWAYRQTPQRAAFRFLNPAGARLVEAVGFEASQVVFGLAVPGVRAVDGLSNVPALGRRRRVAVAQRSQCGTRGGFVARVG